MADNQILPSHWNLATVGELYSLVGGGTPSTKNEDYWNGTIPWISSADIYGLKDIRPRKGITESAISQSATARVPSGSIIVVTRVGLGKVALTDIPLCFSQDSQALIAKDNRVLPEYSLYYLSWAARMFIYQGRGTTIAGITKKQLGDLHFPLPPLPEQERIVAKIEALFTQLDAGTAGLRRIQAELKRYKASVLKAACEGRLVPQDPSDEPAEELLRKMGKTRMIRNNLKPLPEGWCFIQIGDIADHRLGKMLDKEKNKGDLRPYIRNINVRWFSFDLSDILYMRVLEYELDNVSAKKGDLIVCEGGEPGRAAVWNKDESVIIQKALHRVRCKVGISPDYLAYCLGADANTGHLDGFFTGSTIKHFTGESLHAYPVPIPPKEEQIRIVEEVERRLSIIQEIELVVEAALARSARLRQAILKRAFEGRLIEHSGEEAVVSALSSAQSSIETNLKQAGLSD